MGYDGIQGARAQRSTKRQPRAAAEVQSVFDSGSRRRRPRGPISGAAAAGKKSGRRCGAGWPAEGGGGSDQSEEMREAGSVKTIILYIYIYI